MESEVKEFFEKFKKDSGKIAAELPEMAEGFRGLFSKIMKDGALPLKEKELIALGIGVTQKCTPCIRLHVQKALATGASKEEILEAASVAVMMGGGPAFVHIPVVMDALELLQS